MGLTVQGWATSGLPHSFTFNASDYTMKMSTEERARYLKLIEQRALKLAEVAANQRMEDTVPGAKDFLLSRYVHMIVMPAAALMAPELRFHFLGWFLERIREDAGMCSICGKPKANPVDLACQECLADFAAIDAELGLDRMMAPAPSPEPASNQVTGPDPRD